MTPVEYLKKQLDAWKSAMHHSNQSFQRGAISEELHKIHISNLELKIAEYTRAINILHKNGMI